MPGPGHLIRVAVRFLGAMGLLFGLAASAAAEDTSPPRQRLLAPGDAAVTGFSGAPLPVQIAPGVALAAQTFIDLEGPSLRLFDLQDLRGPARAQLVQTQKTFTAKAGQIGQVFGVALDSENPPNIYVAASSAYGLPIVVAGADGKDKHVRKGEKGARFMPGLWGAAPEGGPGSIYKIDGRTGAISLFANVTLDGRKNSGAGLGGLAFDTQSRSLYVADRETGMIHRFGPDGRDLGHYDHGVTGREAQSMNPVVVDPARKLDIESPQFDSADPATWNFGPPERLVYGLAVAARRLYYAVAAGQQIWSVGLAQDGAFQSDPRVEIVVPPAAGPTEISKITFDEQARMFLAERPASTGAFDFEKLTREGIGRVLRYTRVDGPARWRALPQDYAIGFPLSLRNANGGVAISYLYDSKGRIKRNACGGFVWTTGEDLRFSADPTLSAQLRNWGAEHVQGLQGMESWRIRPDNEPPLHAYFTDYDNHFDDASARGHMGDLAIWRECGLAEKLGVDFAAAEGAVAPPALSFPPAGPVPRGQGPKRPPNKQPLKCTQLGACPPPPPSTCKTPPCPPPPPSACKTPPCPPPPPICLPDERRGDNGQCQPITCPAPSALIGGNCCQPGILATAGCSWCQPGSVSVGANNSCCPSSQVYAGANGVSACCPDALVNGQCQPGTPVTPGNPQCQPGQTPPCCAQGYVQTGNICCLAGQATANGVCCPVGEIPDGDLCQPIHFTPPGPSCCAAGQTQTLNGQCCATANINTQGICCPTPINPQEPGSCPAQTQVVLACQPGYTRMPDKSCCLTPHVSRDGKSCEKLPRLQPILPIAPPVARKPPTDCSERGPRFVRSVRNPSLCIRCGRGLVANDGATACVRGAQPTPPPQHAANCSARGPRFINNPDNPAVCLRCRRGMVANDDADACVPAAPRQVAAPPQARAANCAARGPRFIRDPDNPDVCIACPAGQIANRSRTDCFAIPGPPPAYGPPGYYGPPGWIGPRPGGRPPGLVRPPPRRFRPGPAGSPFGFRPRAF